MNTNATDSLSLADVDAVLPAEFQILQPSDPHHDAPHALRVVHHETTEQTYAFDTPQQYLKFVLVYLATPPAGQMSRTPATSSFPRSTTAMPTFMPA